MANFVFNESKGTVSYYCGLPAANDAIIAVAIQSIGIESDASMMTRTSLADVLAHSSEQTTVGRKTMTTVAVSVSNTLNNSSVSFDNYTYTSATGAAIGAIIICYVPDTTSFTDSTIIPLTKHDFSAIPSGSNIPVQISTGGFYIAS